jgi:hypothetical protein
MANLISLTVYEIDGLRLASSKVIAMSTANIIATAYVSTSVGIGSAPAFAASTVYGEGAIVNSNGSIYQVIVGGTSGLIGTAPSNKIGTSVSGTVTFNYLSQFVTPATTNANPVLNSTIQINNGSGVPTIYGVVETVAAIVTAANA